MRRIRSRILARAAPGAENRGRIMPAPRCDRSRRGHSILSTCFVIFGAAVREDGSPSGSLRRRCEAALQAGRQCVSPLYLVTGGVGLHGPAEAVVMREWLMRHGVAAASVIVEDQARDTLQSVRLCSRLLKQRDDVQRVRVCSSAYHAPRCVLLLRLAGVPCDAVAMPSDRPFLGTATWLRYVAKELIATPWDLLVLGALKMAAAV